MNDEKKEESNYVKYVNCECRLRNVQKLYSEEIKCAKDFRDALIITLNSLGRWRFKIVLWVFPEMVSMVNKYMLVGTSFYWKEWYRVFYIRRKRKPG